MESIQVNKMTLRTVLDNETLNKLIKITEKVTDDLKENLKDIGKFKKNLENYHGLLKMQVDCPYMDRLFENMRLNLSNTLNVRLTKLSQESNLQADK